MVTPSLSSLPIRRLTLRDLSACADLSEDRGWPREEHKWGFLLTAGKGYGIDDPGGGLVTACTVTEYGPVERPSLAAVGMVLVAERHARQGVGRRLMRHVVSAQGTTPLTLHATHIITRLPAFADRLHVAEEAGRLIGYAAAWPNMDTHVVGPLIARDTETAKALVTSLAARTDRPLRTDIDVRHEELLAWANERGLAPVASNAVMTYGITELPGDRTRRFAPLTVAAG
ncbi:GNAT family N-acetyltransferase [Streptomyces sp. NPDC048219]|uniref:GNAT family N-acetyltransferase n=1 Tax=Streptomyces sp. NPDC048219 TaxID=3365517 RepID=UPI0037116E60